MGEAEGGAAAAVEKPPLPAGGPGTAAAVAAAVAAAAAAAASAPEPGVPTEEAVVVWSPEVEVCLFHAMLGHKPVGESRPRRASASSSGVGRGGEPGGGAARPRGTAAHSGLRGLGGTDPSRAALIETRIPPSSLPPFGARFSFCSSRCTACFPCVNRHFHMICIRDKFSQNIGRQISSKVIWDHLSTMYDMQALHESEILPFPNIEKNFILPDELIQEVREGKVMMEEEVKEEIKEEMETHAGPEEVFAPSGSLGKTSEKPSSKEKEKTSSDSGSKEGSDKRKRNRVTEKVLNANSNPSSPSAAKRRRT